MLKFYEARKNLLLLLLLFAGTTVWAQEVRVSGKITSSDDGASLPGVNIAEKGTSNGTISDAQGNYGISIKSGATLVFSFVGYSTQEVVVGNQTSINIVLETDVTALSEIVVVGYGTQEKKDVTGSVVAVNTKEFNRGVMTSPQDLLVGKVAGVSVISSSGAPGASSTIRVRGGSSLSASNDPLIVIDGFPVDNSGVSGSPNPLSTINPNDIESFTVLKDASATAIYGSRASNGVIIITTKKGKQDNFQLNYNGSVSVGTAAKFVDVLSANDMRDLATQLESEGFSGLSSTALNRLGNENTDWQKEIYRSAISTDHNISASGSLKNIPYRISYGYTLQQGILKNTDLDRNTINVTANPSFLDSRLNVTANVKSSFSNHNFGNQGAVGAAVAFDPTQPVRNGNTRWGGYYTWTELSQALSDGSNNPEGDRNPIGVSNPVALIEQTDDRSKVNRTIGNVQVDYRFAALPELRVNLNTGLDISTGDGFRNFDENAGFISTPNQLRTNYESTNTSELLDFYVNYKKDFGAHGLDATAGYSWQHFQREGSNYQRNLDGSEVKDSSAYKNENFLVSFFGRVNYSYKDKYLLTASLRNDGSSRFAEENRWGLFPSLALAWNLSQEAFLSSAKMVSNLKLRVGFGVTGQQDIGANYYPYLASYRESTNGASYQLGSTFYSTYRPDPYDANIKWEETTNYNLGLDFGFLQDRITGAVEIYQRKTKDLINFIPIPAGSNFSNYLTTNVGDLENKGFELSLNGKAIQTTDIDWSIGLNFSHNQNEITKLTKTDDPTYPGVAVGNISGGVGNTVQNHQVGYPANSFYVFQQVYDANGRPIEALYVDRTGTGGLVTSNELNKYRYKSPAARALMGINTNFRYKNFDFYASGRLSIGNYVYNNILSDRAVYQSLYNQSGFFNNLPSAVSDTEFAAPQYFSDYYVENASFFRMDNLSAGYNFDKLLTEKLKARISFTVQNAFVVTKYSGLDPEVDGGIDNNIYPRPRTFLLGINLTY
jgi:iron complex outermembrane receptor protein